MQVTKGYSNWKDATVAFNKHEGSNCHREAVEVIVTLPATTVHIGVQLSQEYAREMENWKTTVNAIKGFVMYSIFSSTRLAT